MKKENLLDKFANRAGKVVTDTSGISWGFHNYLADVHSDFFADFSDDIYEDDEQQEKGKIIKLGGQ